MGQVCVSLNGVTQPSQNASKCWIHPVACVSVYDKMTAKTKIELLNGKRGG